MSNAMQFKARIKNLAQKNHVPAQAVLQNFMLERMLIASMVGISSRTTMDMDTTLKGFPLNEETVRAAFMEICAVPLDDEVELVFDHIGPIREDDEYGGFRVAIIAKYASINTPLKIDITAWDVITPKAICYAFPSIFEDKQIEVWAYNIETILAEKVETILRRSVLNTRPRDFYDVYILMQTQGEFIHRDVFQTALRATAEKRMSNKAVEDQDRIVRSIREDKTMKQRWDRYCKENNYAYGIAFDQVIEALINILEIHPPVE